MNKIKNQKSKIKIIVPLLLLILIAFGCQKVEKPMKDGTGPLKIIIEVDEPPESHTANITSEGVKLENPYSKLPVLGKLFKSSLKGLDFWKANHPNFTTGTINPQFIYKDEDGELVSCLDCHEQKTSCNNCHNYIGVKRVSGGEE